jgi:hypothetical protein
VSLVRGDRVRQRDGDLCHGVAEGVSPGLTCIKPRALKRHRLVENPRVLGQTPRTAADNPSLTSVAARSWGRPYPLRECLYTSDIQGRDLRSKETIETMLPES